MPEAQKVETPNGEASKSAIDGIMQIIHDKSAPAHTGKAVYEKDLEMCKFLGATKLKDVFGQRVDESAKDSNSPPALPLNFGSRKSTGLLPDEVRFRLLALKKLISNVEIQANVAFRGQHVTPDMMKTLPQYKDSLEPMLKAYNVTDFNNWIPTLQARFYFEEYEMPFLLADLFDYLPMDSTTMEISGDTGHLEGVEETDVAIFSPQYTTQAKYTVTARNNVVHTRITNDLLSDAAPMYIEKLRRDVMRGTVRSYERTIINGDTTAGGGARGSQHMDLDTRALLLNQTFCKAFDGIRKKAFANDAAIGAGKVVIDHGGDTASKAMFGALLGALGPFSSEKDDLAWILPNVVETALVTGAIPELFTAFAFGGLASNVTGQVPPVFGVRPTVSPYVRTDLDATGVYSGPGENMTMAAIIKKSRFINFVRQATRMWAAPSLPSSDELLMTAKTRHTWNGNPQNADEIGIAMAVNIATY